MTRGKQPPARRNPYALVTRKLGRRIKPSGKIYKRTPKHKSRPHDKGGSSGFRGLVTPGGRPIRWRTAPSNACALVAREM